MANEKDKSFIFYHDFKYIINFLTQAEKGDLLDALIAYSEHNQIPMSFTTAVENAFLYIKNRLDDNFNKRETLRKNGAKGGNPNFKKGLTNPYYPDKTLPKDNQDITKTLPKDNLNANANANVNANVNNITPTPLKPKKIEIDLSFVAENLKPIFQKWLDYKKERGENYKPIGLKTAYNNLLKWSNSNPSIAKNIVDKAIGSNYQGFFEPKGSNNFTTGATNDKKVLPY